MESQEMDRLLALAGELWPRFKPTPLTGEAWLLMLGHNDYSQVKAAMMVHRRESVDWQPDVGSISRLCDPEPEQIDDVIAICDRWYRMTDDNTRYPTRDERDKYPLAAKVYAIAGGYDALHDANWAHQRLRAAYTEAVEAQASHDAHGLVKAITSGEAKSFMAELQRRMAATKELSA